MHWQCYTARANYLTREMVALLGRPCAIEAHEFDINTFPLEESSVELQYLERMVSPRLLQAQFS
jgi:hypothetical protein